MENSIENWNGLLGRRAPIEDSDRLRKAHAGKAVLITGAGGSIGSALAGAVASMEPLVLILLDAAEQGLFRADSTLGCDHPAIARISIVGNVADRGLMQDIFRRYRPDVVYHAAAHKHVPLMETNPFAAVRNNALGTDCLATVAAEHSGTRLLMISTDKAAEPVSVMGASKRIAEMALQAHSTSHTPMNSIRLGNVLGTEGSVAPHFLDQISLGGPVTVTDPEAERFFFTMEEAISLILEAASCGAGGQVLVPATYSQTRILALAKYLIQKYGGATAGEMSIVFTALRPGEKLREQFAGAEEMPVEKIGERLRRLRCSLPPNEKFALAMAELDRTCRTRDLAKMVQAIQSLVPRYSPGAILQQEALSTVNLHD